MQGVILYVDAGKGHFVPAQATAEAMRRLGEQATVEDMFTVLNTPFWHWYCKHEWRVLLRHPKIERIVHRFLDSRFSGLVLQVIACNTHVQTAFVSFYASHAFDYILCTNFLGGAIITAMAQKAKIKVPVFVYAADVFNNPKSGYHKKLDRIFIPTYIGVERLLKQGYSTDQVRLSPFPLQGSIRMSELPSKAEARMTLGLDPEQFTLLLNFGGEGIGSTALMENIGKRNLEWQIVVVGNLSAKKKEYWAQKAKQFPSLKVLIHGFVPNIGLYIIACDVQAGKAGANALMESMALKRPFMISELLYAARDTSAFFEKYGVGWVEKRCKKQADMLHAYARDARAQDMMASRFKKLPLSFSSDDFALLVLHEAKTLVD